MSDKRANLIVLQLVHDAKLDKTDLMVIVSNALDHKAMSRKGVNLVGYHFSDNLAKTLDESKTIPLNVEDTKGKERKERAASKILAFAHAVSPKLAALIKGRPWWHVYLGVCGVILLVNFVLRLLVRTFF